MRSKRMLMGAAVIGCLAATMTSGAYAQEANTTNQLDARTSHQPSTGTQPRGSIRQGQGADMNAQFQCARRQQRNVRQRSVGAACLCQ
jgi:hypothetical protein